MGIGIKLQLGVGNGRSGNMGMTTVTIGKIPMNIFTVVDLH